MGAMQEAALINNIGFPEFTVKLVTDIFDALVAANIKQTEDYLKLVDSIKKSLKEFINETKDDISPEYIKQFLILTLPSATEKDNTIIKKDSNANLSEDDVKKLNAAIKLPTAAVDDGGNQQAVFTTDKTIGQQFDAITQAVAKRISADKYTALQDLVNQGVLRVVVTDGEIYTELAFKAGDSFDYTDVNHYGSSTNTRAGAKVGFWGRLIGLSASGDYTRTVVQTVDTTVKASSTDEIQIKSHVKINFKADFRPLNITPTPIQ